MKKRIISIFIAFCLVLTMLPITVAAETDTAEFIDYNVADTTTWTLQTLDGRTITQNTYKETFRLFLFVLYDCINSQGAVKWLAGSEWVNNPDVEIIVVFDDYSTLEQKKQFKASTAPGNSSIVFAYGDPAVVSNMRYYYMKNTLNPTTLLTYALGVIVDKNDIVRRALSGVHYYSVKPFLTSAVEAYLYKIQAKDTISFDINGSFDYDESAEVYRQLNELRASLGLAPLKLDKKLMDIAMQRAAEISIYYSHTRPNGEDCFSLIPYNYNYSTAGENIAAGQTNAANVMTSWTNSPGHYQNMINPGFDTVGIGCFYQDGAKYWVQFFSGGSDSTEDNRSGKKNQTARITALGSNLNISIMSKNEKLTIGLPMQYSLYNQNMTLSTYNSFNTRIVSPLISSSDSSIASVSSDGMAKGLKEGNVWIRMGISDSIYWDRSVNVVKGYLISYDANGGIGAPEPQAKEHNQYLKLSNVIPTRADHKFLGWATSPTATTGNLKPGGSLYWEWNEDMVLYAIWQGTPYTIRYDLNGGNGVTSPQVKNGGDPLKLMTNVPTRNGYEFLGWATSKDAKVPEYQPGDTFTTMANTTLYAVWKGRSYKVSFDANGGSGAPAAQIKTHNERLTLSSVIPTREGYTFTGWATNPDAAKGFYTPGSLFLADMDLNLYAIWSDASNTPASTPTPTAKPAAVTYTVTFKDWDGKVLKTQTVEKGKAATAPANPTRTGYIFSKWDKAFSKVTGNLVVTAQYSSAQSKPVILTQPVAQTVTVGDGVTFTLKAEGNPAPKYQWQENRGNGWTNISKATTNSLIISKTVAGQSGYKYRCAVSNSKGTIYSKEVKLTVNKKATPTPKPTTTPDANQANSTVAISVDTKTAVTLIATEGSITNSLTVDPAEVPAKDVTYQWAMSKTGKNPPTGTKIKNATAASFEIPGDLKAGTYYYFCVISVKGKEYKRTAITSVVVNAAKANSKAATNVIKVISYPTKTAYKVGGGYDTTGVKVVMTSGGTETNITNKITYHIKKINGVELYKGRKFSTTGDKTVELRYNGQAIGTYDIKVSK